MAPGQKGRTIVSMARKNEPKLSDLTARIMRFRNERDWAKFNNPKDVALSLVLEASEVLEHFQWKNGKEVEKYVKNHKSEIGEEIADVLAYALVLAHDIGIDVAEVFEAKMKKNELKYPVEKAKGRAVKYNQL